MIALSSGVMKGLKLKSPRGDQTRPSSERLRQGCFNVLRGPLLQGANVIDFFGGSGAWGLEALSNGAKSVHFVENHPLALDCLKQNLGLAQRAFSNQGIKPQLFLWARGVEETYSRLPKAQVVFADPPYRLDWFPKLMDLERKDPVLEKNGVFLFESLVREGYSQETYLEMARQAHLFLFNEKIYGDSVVHFFVKK